MPCSKLYWHLGIGWPSIFMLLIVWFIWKISSGVTNTIIVIIFWTLVLFFIYRIHRWNYHKWARIFRRGMLIYSACAGTEAALARNEGRDFELYRACKDMAYRMVDPTQLQIADGIVNDANENSFYLFEILDKEIRSIYKNLDEIEIQKILYSTVDAEFGPQLVLVGLVLNQYGFKEAARLIIALLTGKAK